jgi:hypothetical protein
MIRQIRFISAEQSNKLLRRGKIKNCFHTRKLASIRKQVNRRLIWAREKALPLGFA